MLDEPGSFLAKRRIGQGLEGAGQLHALLADHAHERDQVVVGIKTDRACWWRVAGGWLPGLAIKPLAASRYRDRHATSGAKSDPGDAKIGPH